jgi:streptogramin lyase
MLVPALAWAACGGDDGAVDGGDVPDEHGDVDDAGDGEAGGCVDLDFDLHGPGCAAGPDCDDADPLHFSDCATCTSPHPPAGCQCLPPPWPASPCYEGPAGTLDVGQCAAGTRACVDNQLVYECAGQTLPAAAEICGNFIDDDCNGVGDQEAAGECGSCDTTCRSSGVIRPDPADPRSTGLASGPSGTGVVLGVTDIHASFAWVANTGEGSVSRLDLATGAEQGRYRVGQTGTANDAPSRTAVDGVGDLYVANQADVDAVMNVATVTKIAGDRTRCVDANRNGTIETSSGSTRLRLGEDECVLWTVPVCGEAGMVPRALAVHAPTAGAPGWPWVGCFGERRFHRLSPANGASLESVDVEVDPFGAAAGTGDWIWVVGRGGEAAPGLQRFDAATGGIDPVVPPPSECDPYGVAVDDAGDVWVGGTRGSVCRYRPGVGWAAWPVPRANALGVAVGVGGFLWAVSHDGTGVGLSAFPLGDPDAATHVEIPGAVAYAVDVDELGRVWTVNLGSDSATRYDPATGEATTHPVGARPAGYGRFVGFDRDLVAGRGTGSVDRVRCAEGETDRWGELRWTATTPAGSSVSFAAQSADSAAGLDGAASVDLGGSPGTLPPVDLEAAFAAASVPLLQHLRITVTLEAGSEGESPLLEGFEVRWHCAE